MISSVKLVSIMSNGSSGLHLSVPGLDFLLFPLENIGAKINKQQQLTDLYTFESSCIATFQSYLPHSWKFITVRGTGRINYLFCYLFSLMYFRIYIWKKSGIFQKMFSISLKNSNSYHTKYKAKHIRDAEATAITLCW